MMLSQEDPKKARKKVLKIYDRPVAPPKTTSGTYGYPESSLGTHTLRILFPKACMIGALPTQIMPPACMMGPSEHVLYIYIYIYILYKYITYLARKTMIVQNNIKHI